MSEDITNKIQGRADILTNERKRRGKTVPEGLATSEDISNYRQLASHTVSQEVTIWILFSVLKSEWVE